MGPEWRGWGLGKTIAISNSGTQETHPVTRTEPAGMMKRSVEGRLEGELRVIGEVRAREEEDKEEEEGQLFKGKHYGEAKQERVSEWVE
jgi:hypothetical protein